MCYISQVATIWSIGQAAKTSPSHGENRGSIPLSTIYFLKQNKIFNNFSESCIEAENGIGLNTVTCSILCRRALELGVKWLYANDNDLTIPYQDNLSALVHDITFKNIIDEKLLKQIEYIIKLGNFAVHNNKKISREEAILSLKYLYNFMQWIAYCYSDNFEEKEFDESILQTQSVNVLAVKEKESLYEELEKKDKKLEETRKASGETELKGKGVGVTVNDSKADATGAASASFVIHDEDLLLFVNELNSAGAEAVSINGQRITSRSSIKCAGSIIKCKRCKIYGTVCN